MKTFTFLVWTLLTMPLYLIGVVYGFSCVAWENGYLCGLVVGRWMNRP